MKMVSKNVLFSVIVVSLLLLFTSTLSNAQVKKRYALKRTTELGGSISFEQLSASREKSTTDEYYNISEKQTIITMSPYIGYFFQDGFAIAVNPLYVRQSYKSLYSDSDRSQIWFFINPSYVINIDGATYPFIEAQLGFISLSNGSTKTGFSYGGRVGVKIEIAEHVLLNCGFQYMNIDMEDDDNTDISRLSLLFGFSIWL